ncbi:MAG: GTP cyclohydrolase II [Bradymonadales bacterium]
MNLVRDDFLLKPDTLQIYAKARLPTQFGEFQVYAFSRGNEKLDDVALVRGDVAGKQAVATRLHSECVTGDVFHSLRCDCRQQLEFAQEHFATMDEAILLYLRQEGRGIGLASKVAAYKLQEEGYDTVDANIHLGFDDDLRSYALAAGMLHSLGVASIELYTNNPKKIQDLQAHGIHVLKRRPIIIKPNPYNARYLKTKQVKSGHLGY